MIPNEAKELFKIKFESFGSIKFYKFLLNYAISKVAEQEELVKKKRSRVKGIEIGRVSPEVELMDYHDRFLDLFRVEGEVIYLDIAKLFRRAAHSIYRVMLKKNLIKKSDRFLNTIE
jgi:hypothetical protein